MGKKFIVGMAATALMAVAANAQQPVLNKDFKSIEPLRMRSISPSGEYGPWITYKGNGNNRAAWAVAYDAFEADKADPNWPAAPPSDNQYGVDCGLGGGRWWFGATYDNPYSSNDMNVAQGMSGKNAEFVNIVFTTQVTEQFYYVLWTSESVDETGNGVDPVFAGQFNGVQYDFGVMQAGNWYSNIDLTGSGLSHQMPADGRGGYQIFHANATTGGGGPNGLRQSTLSQNFLWGTQGTNPSSQDEWQYDDDNPAPDEKLTPGNWVQGGLGERYSYAYGVCPDPLCASVAFYVAGSGGNTITVCPSTANVVFGSVASGSVNDVCTSNDTRHVINNGNTFLITQSPITVEYFGTSSILNPTQIVQNYEGHVSLGGLTLRLDKRRYSDNTWEQLTQKPAATGSDEVVTNTITTNASNYVNQTNGQVGNRVRVKDDTPAFLVSWQGRFDMVNDTITG